METLFRYLHERVACHIMGYTIGSIMAFHPGNDPVAQLSQFTYARRRRINPKRVSCKFRRAASMFFKENKQSFSLRFGTDAVVLSLHVFSCRSRWMHFCFRLKPSCRTGIRSDTIFEASICPDILPAHHFGGFRFVEKFSLSDDVFFILCFFHLFASI